MILRISINIKLIILQRTDILIVINYRFITYQVIRYWVRTIPQK